MWCDVLIDIRKINMDSTKNLSLINSRNTEELLELPNGLPIFGASAEK